MPNNIFKRLNHFFLYLFAFVTLTSAIVITIIRLVLPGIGEYRQQAQDWISQTMNYPVEISDISADWDSWSPKLHLHRVSILDPDSDGHVLNFNSVTISIDIFKSLIGNKITPQSIIASGLSLTLIRRQDGSVTVSKYLPDDFPEDFKGKQLNNNALATWFLSQKNILIKNAQITLFDLNENDDPLLLSDATLRMRNNKYRTQIEGTAILPESYGHILNFALDASGNVLTPDWSGEIYLEGKNINISPLLAEIEDLDLEKHEGTGDIKIWSTWTQAKLSQLEGQIKLRELKLAGNQSKVLINKLSGNFVAIRKTNKGVELAFDLEELLTPNGQWPKSEISLNKIYDHEHDKYQYITRASYLNIDDVDSFLKIFSNLPDQFSPPDDFMISGILKNSVIKYDPTLDASEKIYIESEFSQLGAQHYDHSLKLEGLTGYVQGTQHQGSIRITSNTTKLELENFLIHPLTFYELNTELNWQFQNNNLTISTQLLDTHTQDFNLKLKGNLEFNQNRTLPFINVLLELSDGEVDKVVNYLPGNLPEELTQWLKSSLVTGKIPSAEFAFRGWAEDYPFKNNEGVFRGFAEVSHGTLDYHEAWPPIDGINAEIIVNNDTLTIDASSGNIFDAEVTEASAVIANLAANDLEWSIVINAHINSELKDGLLFLKNSPLQMGSSLNNLSPGDISGSLSVDLDLDIPLSSELILSNGTISLHEASFDSEDIGIVLTDINGTIDFTQDSVFAKGIKAFYFNHPVELAIEHSHDSTIRSTLSGRADKQFISAQLLRYFPSLVSLKPEIEKRITGSTSWQASIIEPDPDGKLKTGKELLITSTLEGLSIDLPLPLAKSFDSTPLELSIRFPEKNKQKINIQYANVLDGIININEINGEKVAKTSLSFGNKVTHDNENNSLSITGNIDRLIVSEWFDFLPSSSSGEKKGAKEKTVALDIQVGSLEFINQHFSDANLKLNSIDSGYHLNVSAEDINGDIYLDHSIDKNPVNINLKKLKLVNNEPEITDGEKKYALTPDTIPPLNIEISEFIYNNIGLGRINLAISKMKNGLSFDNINFSKTDMVINGSGVWDIINNEHHSKFSLTLNAASMKTMLGTFDYDVAAIEEGKTNLALDGQWQGTPVDFSLTNLSGILYMDIEKGRFTDIEPAAGRLFGLLSLQTLPRRLSLDFSDLFSKGLAFDDIEGHFNIENGNAYTNNLAMSGPSVDITISGRTGLIKQDYDQIATITPKVSGSLPVASALFGPIGVGVGAVIFLANELFQSLPEKIDTLLREQYTITGAWDAPQITKINQNKEAKIIANP